jgi:uncharacterized membrane protein YfhO
VNGEEQEIVTIGGAMLGLLLEEGEHEIEFRYHNPHLTMGAAISVSSLVMLILFYVLDKKFMKKFLLKKD